jgi:hypothetical protein
MDTKRSKELWDRLENEPRRAFEAFQTFLSLPSGDRTIIEAYRVHVDNPEAVKPSDTWGRWSRDFAWSERAAAYDDHLASMRREAYERGIEEEAERQGALAERNRNRMNELMTLGYERAMEWFENTQPSDLRAQDVIQIIRLHMDAVKAFDMDPGSRDEDTWTEEDDREFAETILNEMAQEDEPDEPDENQELSADAEGG